ncbi:MAG: phosphate signaling complex protein PhoU [Gammaproteobacteria bacterium]|nr:phosphate signaling complex protein PhoU [Gammaproteobacteria bacterium]MDH5728293.1 phosphate signaling complex protein PhoU [Gammaproteobacteria bacterium]
MDKSSIGQHISQQFNIELEEIRSRVLAMGGLVEEQIANAIKSLIDADVNLAQAVIENDINVNAAEVAIDEECSHVIARRQPAASDLRLIVAVIKTITDLERIGDQAERIARMGMHLAELERPKNNYIEIQAVGERVRQMVHKALDAFARMDIGTAIEVAEDDLSVDQEYDGIMRQALTFMMEDPRSITRMLDVMWTARAIERIGDHAKNISEYVIYLVKGKDVRHTSLEQIQKQLKSD